VIVKGTIKEIRPEMGLVVTLDKGLEGIVSRSTLVKNFPAAFTSGETIRFAIVKISLVNGQSRAEGLVVDR
jgi:ribosomal protein S1